MIETDISSERFYIEKDPTLQASQDEQLGTFVGMGGLVVATATDPKPLVGTTSLGSCAGVSIYDPERRVGGVNHVFFNEKQQVTQTFYMHDSTGRAIPGTGRITHHVVDDPRWYREFGILTTQLLQTAERRGGQQFEMTTFNIDHGCRTAEQNVQLRTHVNETVAKLQKEGKVTRVNNRNDDAFVLDTRSGLIRRPDFLVRR